jgi:hypothetical protein
LKLRLADPEMYRFARHHSHEHRRPGSLRRPAALLTAHAQLAVRPKRNARKLLKGLAQSAVLIAWLIDQAAMIERIRRCAKRRRDLRAGLV